MTLNSHDRCEDKIRKRENKHLQFIKSIKCFHQPDRERFSHDKLLFVDLKAPARNLMTFSPSFKFQCL